MPSIRQWALCSIIGLCSLGGAQAAITVNGTLDPSDPSIPGGGRLFRDAIVSTCGAAKAFPGTTGVGTAYGYKTTTAFNNAAETCITVNVDQGTCNTNAFTTAYLGTFNPNDLSQNYLGDQGSSLTGPFSFMAPANSQIVLMTSSTAGAITEPCSYTITSDNLSSARAAVSVNPVPTLSTWAAWALTLLMAAVGITVLRRRS